MGDPKGFLKHKRKATRYRPVKKRVKDYQEVFKLPSRQKSVRQGLRCMDCGTPFCHWGCPVGNYIPEWNDNLSQGKWRKAYELLQETNNFPEVTGRICPALCEYSCVLGINDEPITIRENELAIIENAFKAGFVKPRKILKRTGKKVAVVGSGPAGLACADQLNKAGHTVSVFEKDDEIGGIMRYGIPDFKLDKRIIGRRIALLEKEGIIFIKNAHVGGKYRCSALKREYDAICLTGGSREARDLRIEGRELSGIYFAMDYLMISNMRVAGKTIRRKGLIDA